ncbi:hypothetical protein [Streptomyces sp. NPDC006879]|uniref:hypothetical protein n=1 Tax=Streptomyces sp. NPDC006879 TaxID=3364767 RepID=UPI0036AD6690
MQSSVVRRFGVVAGAVSLALVVTACGSGSDEASGDKGDKAAGSTRSAAPETKPAVALGEAELEKLALATADLSGHKVEPAKPADIVAATDVSTDKAECKPLAEAAVLISTGSPAATVRRKALAAPEEPAANASEEEKANAAMMALGNMTVTSIALGSYEGTGAKDALALLRTAGEACAGGFKADNKGAKTNVVKVAPVTVSGGEEAAGWALTIEDEGEKSVFQVAAARQGGTLATFMTVAFGKDGAKEVPPALIEAQLKKLG